MFIDTYLLFIKFEYKNSKFTTVYSFMSYYIFNNEHMYL